MILRKGFRPHIDSYSAFFENDRTTPTGLAGYLRERGVTEVWLAGLATDFCVAYSALDAVALGFAATLIEDACREIDLDGRHAAALAGWATPASGGLARRPREYVAMTDIATRVHDHNWRIDPIVRSLLDTDFYKLLMLQTVYRRHADVTVEFSLINRTEERAARPADRRGGPAGAARPHPHAAADARRVDLAARQHLLRQAPDVRRRRHGVAR